MIKSKENSSKNENNVVIHLSESNNKWNKLATSRRKQEMNGLTSQNTLSNQKSNNH